MASIPEVIERHTVLVYNPAREKRVKFYHAGQHTEVSVPSGTIVQSCSHRDLLYTYAAVRDPCSREIYHTLLRVHNGRFESMGQGIIPNGTLLIIV